MELCGLKVRVFICAVCIEVHIRLRDMMSVWREHGSNRLIHNPGGASVMMAKTSGTESEALPKQASTNSQPHLFHHTPTERHKFTSQVSADLYWWWTFKS